MSHWESLRTDEVLITRVIAAAILANVIAACPSLDQQYQDQHVMAELLRTQPTLHHLFFRCWQNGDFSEIRRLKIFQKSVTPSVNYPVESEKAVRDAFAVEYVGKTDQLLLKTLSGLYDQETDTTYMRAIAIVQSSGTGKSRVVDEVAKARITFPFCLRERVQDFAYPPPDDVVREFLCGSYNGESHPGRKPFVRLLASLFDKAREDLLKIIFPSRGPPKYNEIVGLFHDFFAQSNYRERFYIDLVDKAKSFQSPILGESDDDLSSKAGLAFDKFYDALCGICQDVPQYTPPVIIYFDEVHVLFADKEKSRNEGRSAYDELCSVLGDLKKKQFATICLSTASKLSGIAPPRDISNSYRFKNPENILPSPFTELPFDLFRHHVVEGTLDRDDVSSFDFLVKFGRPMWATLYHEWSKKTLAKHTIMELAKHKLIAHSHLIPFHKMSEKAQLAVVSTRLSLDFDPARAPARSMEEALVASHMRIAFSVPEHREFMRTGTPSEPILAEAAAQIMNREDCDLLLVLNDYLKDGLASKGERGELVGRVLDILAIDSAISAANKKCPPAGVVKFGRPIPVLDYLQHLFPETYHQSILDSTPANPRDIAPMWVHMRLREAFQDAYIHLTHYVKAGDSSVLGGRYLWGYWARGAGFQLKPGAALTDRILPIHWTKLPGPNGGTDLEQKLSRHTTSAILHQDKNNASISIDQVPMQKPEKLGMFGPNIQCKPVIAITNLYASNEEPGVRASNPPRNQPRNPGSDAPIYEIHAFGLGSQTYKVIANQERFKALLGRGRVVDEHARRGEDWLNAVRALQPEHTREPASVAWMEFAD